MLISVVLCTYNGADSLGTALKSLSKLSVPDGLSWEVVLVNNNSTDDTEKIIEEFARTSGLNVQQVFEPKQGRAFAMNAGIRRASGEVLAFTDDDVIIDSQWLAGLSRTFADFECIGVGGRVVPVWHQPKPTWLEMEGQQVVGHFEYGDEPKQISLPPIGANMAFRRLAFEKYGLFQAELGVNKSEIGGTEDDEFGRRLLRAGETIMYAPRAIIRLPVESHRLTKEYFLRWFYSMGKANMRARMWPQEAVCYFGVPRYLFGAVIRSSFRWAITFQEKHRFKHKLLVYRALGGIREGWRSGRRTQAEIPRL
jgi:glycosyltransferase involved in cell wall biosynthesis